MKTLLPLCAFILFPLFNFAQNFDLRGKIIDDRNKAIPYASIGLSLQTDSSIVQFSVSKDDGSFAFKAVPAGKYLLVVACYGYDVSYKEIDVSTDLDNIVVRSTKSTISFEEIMVKANKIPILLNGDTVVYNSESFKTQSNANVEDLIRKMPGIQVNRDGTISSEGQQVTKILINGKEFFGGNVEAATKNLDADLVDKVEVIDRKTDEDEFTEQDGNEREKVINLVLKDEHTKGFFGTIRAGYGTEDYYDLHGNINFFKDETQLSIIGGANNLNRRLYGWQAMSTLQSFEITPFNQSNRMTWWNGGVKSYNGGGANLHFSPLKDMQVDLAYVLTRENNIRISDRDEEVYLEEGTLFRKSLSEFEGEQSVHQLNATVEWETDSVNRFVWRSQLSTQQGLGLDLNQTYNFTEARIINSGVNRDENDGGNEKFATKLHWTRKRKSKPSDYFLGSLYYGGSSITKNYLSYFKTDTSLLPLPLNEDPILEQRLKTVESTVAFTSAYQIEINDKWTLRPGLNYIISEYSHRFIWSENENEPIAAKSPKGRVQAQNIEYYAHLILKLDSFTTLHFVPEINQSIEDRRFTTDSLYHYRFNQSFFIPYMFLRSTKQHKYNFRFNVSANVDRPQINQVMPVVDNSNPYQTTIGNIELQNFMRYRNNWQYQKIFGIGKILSFSGWTTFRLNPVVNSNQITEDNYSISNVVNFKHSFWSNHEIGMLWPVKFLKAQLGVELDYGRSQSFFIRNSEELRINNVDIGIGPNLQFNEFDLWSLELDYQLKQNKGKIGGIENNAYINHEIDAELVITPIDRLEFASGVYWEIYGSNNAVGAASIPILSAELSFFFDKQQHWSLGAKAFDILDQNRNLWRWWNANTFVQNNSNAIQRYFMATLTYKIRKASPRSDRNI